MSPAESEPVENESDPRGEFATFLRSWVAIQASKRTKGKPPTKTAVIDALADELGLQRRAVQKWLKGTSGPNFQQLDEVAQALGFPHWGALGTAIKRRAK